MTMATKDELIAQARAAVAGGMSRRQTARLLGVNRSCVDRWCKEDGVCRGPECRSMVWAHGLCHAHYRQSECGELSPISPSKRAVSTDDAQYAVSEWHFLRGICGLSAPRTVLRLGLSPRTLIGRFEMLDLVPPEELLPLRGLRMADLERRLDERLAVAG